MRKNGRRNAKACQKNNCDGFGAEEDVCPVCDNTQLTFHDSELRDKTYACDWECIECGASGEQLYHLKFVAMIVN